MTKCDCEGTEAVTFCKDCGIGTTKAERIAEVAHQTALEMLSPDGDPNKTIGEFRRELNAKIRAIEQEEA